MRDEQIRPGRWVSVAEGLPPEKRCVLVMTREAWIPLVGYTKDNGSGFWWVVPGHGGEVLWWSDSIPGPLPMPDREAFRHAHERNQGCEMADPSRARKP